MSDEFKSFEESLSSLRKIAESFENSEEMTLEEMLKGYEEGMKAYSYCMGSLDETQKQIKIIESKYQ